MARDKKSKPKTKISDASLATTLGRDAKAFIGAVNPPVYHASTILFDTYETLKNLPDSVPYTYGRFATPTSQALTDSIAHLEGGAGSFLTPSGLSACVLALISAVRAGDHILVTDSVYGPTRQFCDSYLAQIGVAVDYYDPAIGAAIDEQITDKTAAVFVESPGSVTMDMQDIPAISAAAHAKGAVVLMDNTWATPLFFKPLQHGVDISIQAATKYIVGHSDAMLGVVTANAEMYDKVKQHHRLFGLCAAPDDIYLALRGLRTLPVRLQQHMANALHLAQWLREQPIVREVLYPALPEAAGHALWQRDFLGASGLFSILLEPCSDKAIAAMIDNMRFFKIGYSWGGYESLIVPFDSPRVLRFCEQSGHAGARLLRLHIGLEDAQELQQDLKEGFERLTSTG